MISLQKIDSRHPLFEQVFSLRDTVLRKPLGLSLYDEDTSGDADDDIFVAVAEEGIVVGCLMAKPTAAHAVKLRQMAVAEAFQQRGVGKMLMLEAEQYLHARGFRRIGLHARQYALGFYEKLGYKAYGDIFTEVGIPHLAMEKQW